MLQIPEGSVLRAGNRWADDSRHLLTCIGGCSNLTITGSGIIDGVGSQWWKGLRSPNPRPHLLNCACTDVVVEGVTLQNAASYHMVVHGQRWSIGNVKIRSPGYIKAPNTDGIQITAQDVHVHHCDVENGDDSIVVKPGSRRVLVEDCRVAQGNGLVVGTGGDIHDIVFRRCIVDGTQYGCHIKAKDEQTGDVSNITFQDILVKSVQNQLLINAWYAIGINQNGQTLGAASPFLNTSSSVRISNVTFRNITCGGKCGGNVNPFAKRRAGIFACNSGNLACTNIKFEQVHLDAACSFENVYGSGVDVDPTSCTPPSSLEAPVWL